jgi:hypothetical protein
MIGEKLVTGEHTVYSKESKDSIPPCKGEAVYDQPYLLRFYRWISSAGGKQ